MSLLPTMLRALRVAGHTATVWNDAPDTPVTVRITLQVPRGQMARLSDRMGGVVTDATTWRLKQEAKKSDTHTRSEAHRVRSVLERNGAHNIRVDHGQRGAAPSLVATLTPNALATVRRLLGPTLDSASAI